MRNLPTLRVALTKGATSRQTFEQGRRWRTRELTMRHRSLSPQSATAEIACPPVETTSCALCAPVGVIHVYQADQSSHWPARTPPSTWPARAGPLLHQGTTSTKFPLSRGPVPYLVSTKRVFGPSASRIAC